MGVRVGVLGFRGIAEVVGEKGSGGIEIGTNGLRA